MNAQRTDDTGPSATRIGLTSLVDELRAGQTYARDGHVARTLFKASDFRVVLIVLAATKSMPEHQVNATASVQLLEGTVRMKLPQGEVELSAGQLFLLEASCRHDVHADSDSALLLTFGWHGE